MNIIYLNYFNLLELNSLADSIKSLLYWEFIKTENIDLLSNSVFVIAFQLNGNFKSPLFWLIGLVFSLCSGIISGFDL